MYLGNEADAADTTFKGWTDIKASPDFLAAGFLAAGCGGGRSTAAAADLMSRGRPLRQARQPTHAFEVTGCRSVRAAGGWPGRPGFSALHAVACREIRAAGRASSGSRAD